MSEVIKLYVTIRDQSGSDVEFKKLILMIPSKTIF